MKIGEYEVYLKDYGTLDTVLNVYSPMQHYANIDGDVVFSQEYASQFRKENGDLTDEGFEILANEAIEEYEERLSA